MSFPWLLDYCYPINPSFTPLKCRYLKRCGTLWEPDPKEMGDTQSAVDLSQLPACRCRMASRWMMAAMPALVACRCG